MHGFKTKRISIEEFNKIKDNPVQRNTEEHARSAVRPNGHLSVISPTHRKVSYAVTADGKKSWVLDGHTRRFLWERGELEAPKSLSADVYTVDDIEGAIELYYMFDSMGATESGGDKIFGALRYHNFIPRTKIFQYGGFNSAATRLVSPQRYSDLKNLSKHELIKPWITTMKIIDNSAHCIRSNAGFPSWVFTAMLCTVERDKSVAMSFWEAYALDEGTKDKTTMDGIFAARLLLQYQKESHYKRGNSLIADLTPAILELYERWKAGERLPYKGRGYHPWGLKAGEKLLTVGEWWRKYIGDYWYPQIRRKTEK